MKTKPIVPWMGGKRRLVSQLIEKCLSTNVMWNCLLEVQLYFYA